MFFSYVYQGCIYLIKHTVQYNKNSNISIILQKGLKPFLWKQFVIICWVEKQHLFWNIINAFNAPFDQFNVSLLNKSIHFFILHLYIFLYLISLIPNI